MTSALVTHLIAAAIAAAGAWMLQAARMDAAVTEVRLEHADERAQADAAARAAQRSIDARYQEALNAARTREATLRRDRDAARTESDGLREQAVDAARRIAAAPPAAAVAEYAAAVGELLADCSRSYQELAAEADGHAADVRLMLGAWPLQGNLSSADDSR